LGVAAVLDACAVVCVHWQPSSSGRRCSQGVRRPPREVLLTIQRRPVPQRRRVRGRRVLRALSTGRGGDPAHHSSGQHYCCPRRATSRLTQVVFGVGRVSTTGTDTTATRAEDRCCGLLRPGPAPAALRATELLL